MSEIFVAGLINVETSLKVDSFPVTYEPVRYSFHSIQNSVSGVGYNIASALSTLGHKVNFASITGDDLISEIIFNQLTNRGISTEHIIKTMPYSANSVNLYDASGQRAIFTDLKDIQETQYPVDKVRDLIQQSEIAVICNVNFARPMLSQAKTLGKLVATYVHAISNITDEYNADYMRHADILFMSHEQLPTSPETWIKTLWQHYDNQIIVIGMGKEGALLGIKAEQSIHHVPATHTRAVVNTVGAGDAMFSGFIHSYLITGDAYQSLRIATTFASYKIGASGGAEGFLSSDELSKWHNL